MEELNWLTTPTVGTVIQTTTNIRRKDNANRLRDKLRMKENGIFEFG